jgi:hypothetical protein
MLLTLALLLSSTAPISVPKGAAPKIDGVLGDEWKDAKTLVEREGSRILAKHDGEDLYLAMEGKKASIASIQLQQGDKVRILHASAALGDADYAKAGEKWNPGKGFVWACRKMDDSAESLAEQANFYKEQGWLSNTGPQATTREYKISKKVLGPMAIALFGFQPEGTVVSLPSSTSDDAFHPKLIGGWQPEGLSFRPQSWVTFKLE